MLQVEEPVNTARQGSHHYSSNFRRDFTHQEFMVSITLPHTRFHRRFPFDPAAAQRRSAALGVSHAWRFRAFLLPSFDRRRKQSSTSRRRRRASFGLSLGLPNEQEKRGQERS